jgi:4-hydroxy-2-oxoheptanedioate aldolase
MAHDLKARLKRGEPVFGTFAFMASPDIVEIIGYAGFDYVIIDLEHSPKNWSDVANMIRAAELHGMAALVRIRENAEKSILEVLELGAAGIVVPFVQTADDVHKAVRATNYAPKGGRGTCTLTRAARYGGLRSEFLAHCVRQNENLVVVGQIEDRAGVDQIDAIVSCEPGLDALIVGRSDLASSLGEPGQVEAPAVLEATGRVVEAARRKGVAAGIGIYSPAEASRWIDAGCSLFFYSADTTLLLNAAAAANKDFRQMVAQRG